MTPGYRIFRILGFVIIATPWAGGFADELADKSTVALAMGVACWAWAEALKKDRRIDQLERFCQQVHMRGKNLRQGARIEDFRDVFR